MNETTTDTQPACETRAFDTEVHQLLKLMINSLYSNREIFVRELISNASDAIDKLRFEALTNAELQAAITAPGIELSLDVSAGQLIIEDSGIGMTRDEVIENLGTIARSGTAQFLQSLSGDAKQDAQLIGQFGVGFYSSFIVAERVTVDTLKAGESSEAAVRWQSEGQGEYSLETSAREQHGTRVVLHLAEAHRDLLDIQRLEGIIRHYSNHVAFPIRLLKPMPVESAEEDDAQPSAEQWVQINDTQALWTRPKSELSKQEYEEFYTGLTGDFEPPSSWAHHHVEGNQCYSMLLYLPSQPPF
ncbi:MAG: ATP-binding protein, partial [Pseudomonadota bacterium]